MKNKIINAVAIATVSIISTALVAYLKEPKNRAYLKREAKKAKKAAQKQFNLFQEKVAALR